jgi:hypothetical protein
VRRIALAASLAAISSLGACKKTGDGQYQVKTPDVHVSTDSTTIRTPTVTTRTDTINTPVVGTQKETLVVNKPVVGTKKTAVKTPVVRAP